jgi:hypothetical protein
MVEDNVTPMLAPKVSKPRPGPKEVAKALGRLQKKVHVTFCTLECASAALQKAEDDQDMDRWIRAGRVVERCVEELESIREDVDSVTDMADISEVAHG